MWTFLIFYSISVLSTSVLGQTSANENADSDMLDPSLLLWTTSSNPAEGRELFLNEMRDTINSSADYCEDFYEYACGNWGKKLRYTPTWQTDKIAVWTQNIDAALVEMLNSSLGDNQLAETKAKIFFRSCMDSEKINERGLEPLNVQFQQFTGHSPAQLGTIDDEEFDWLNFTAKLNFMGLSTFFAVDVEMDVDTTSYYVTYLDSANLLMKEASYYADEKFFYPAFLKRTMRKVCDALKLNVSDQFLNEIHSFDLEIGRIVLKTRTGLGGIRNLTVGDLQDQIAKMDWGRYLNIALNRDIDASDGIRVTDINYMKEMTELLSNTSAKTIRDYLYFRYLLYLLYNLDRAVDTIDTFFLLHFEYVEGKRDKFCLDRVKIFMTDVLTNMFSKKYFTRESKQLAEEMANDLKTTFYNTVKNSSSWIDVETRGKILSIIRGISIEIGSPSSAFQSEELDKHYGDLTLFEDKYFENILNIDVLNVQHKFKLNGTAINHTIWLQSPLKSAPFYSPLNTGTIHLPVGFLQPPFFSRHFTVTDNFGSLGSIIGHEFMHSIDKGNLKKDVFGKEKQWNSDFLREYDEKLECVASLFENYTRNDLEHKVESEQTINENFSDTYGLKIAYIAYKDSRSKYGTESFAIYNLTQDQKFFVSFAQNWCDDTVAFLVNLNSKDDKHSPNKQRVLGAVANLPEFSEAFNCPTDSPMNSQYKCNFF